MEQLQARIYEKYTALKKRKLLEEGLERKREAELKELYDAMKDWVKDLQKENEELNEKLADKQDDLEKARADFLEGIRARDSEILRLKQLLDEKTDKNYSRAIGSMDITHEVIQQNPTPVLPEKKTPQSNSKAKRVRLSEEAIGSHSSAEESQELECCRRHTCISGNGTHEGSSAHMFHLLMLLQSLVRMKISLNDGMERFSVSVSHESSGYCFTLTWLEKTGEWSYKLSSLGTLERIAVDWMRQDIRFSMNMCRKFFERISSIITKG